MNPLVSIIIPCYNVELYIKECLDSAIKQDHENIEIICVENNSTDNTLVILNEIKRNYPIKILSETSEGASFARNKGLFEAAGEYIQFLDADDILKAGKISTQLSLIKKSEKIPDVVIGNYCRLKLSGEKKIFSFNNDDIWLSLMTSRLGITSSNLWKKDTLLKINGWNPELKSSQEYDLLFRILKSGGHLIFDKEPNSIVRDRESSISQNNLAENWDRFCNLRAEVINFLQPTFTENPERKKILYQALFDSIRTLYKYNSELATKHFFKYIPPGFFPSVSSATSKLYILLYMVLGFVKTEKSRQLFGLKVFF